MTKAPSPLLGYNNNVRHKGRVFHIQTEDSGVNRPHVITHLFMDGGRILKSIKTSYAEQVGKDKLGEVVKKMMKDQHKAMFTALRDGGYDQLIEDALRSGSQPRLAAANAKARGKSAPPPPIADSPKTQRDPEIVEVTEPLLAPADEVEAELNLDLDALERASQETDTSAPRSSPDLPPPPANLLRERMPPTEPDTGRYRSLSPAAEERIPASTRGARSSPAPRPSPRPSPRSERTPPPPRPAARPKSERPAARSEKPTRRSERPPPPPSVREDASAAKNDPRAEPPSDSKQPIAPRADGRFAPARPAAIFGQARPQQGTSIFGEDLISDKSLDEVILSYLAEDLEDGTK